MVPYQVPPSASSIGTIPPLTRSSTLPVTGSRFQQAFVPDRTLLTPEDAIYAGSPPRRSSLGVGNDLRLPNGKGSGDERSRRRRGHKDRNSSASRRRKVIWKKILWVKQSYPDNYTDQETFLEHLQRNPRLQPYDFWPLVADSTVIVQHVCSVIIFVVCFVVIFQERVSPVAIVSWGSIGTVLGWWVWDRWVAQDEAAAASSGVEIKFDAADDAISAASSTTSSLDAKDESKSRTLSLASPPRSPSPPAPRHSHSASASSFHSQTSASASATGHPTGAPTFANYTNVPLYGSSSSSLSPRTQQRLATAKSAILIYSALLGLSPILKSLTKSTSSDSIWAMSCWLMIINVFFFDYGSEVSNGSVTSVKLGIPASLSTNAALMASTVLASRLPSTEHVFSLTLFSIEVFGLFPVFRRYLRHKSWRGHLALTAVLVMGAGGGVGVVVSGGGWKAALVGVLLGNLLTGLAMGGCSWWLIGLQKYKNEIHGPWDPARPIIRRRWGERDDF